MQIEYTLIDTDDTEIGELTLYRYEAQSGETGYEIRINDNFLMGTHGALGEIIMANVAHEYLVSKENLHVLIGGLGAGHTLRAVLNLQGVTRVTVAEIGSKVEKWNKLYFAESNGNAVSDKRVSIIVSDLARVITQYKDEFDLMLLDVDNGPDWLAADKNARLYQDNGIKECLNALKTNGILAVWSPGENPKFMEALLRVTPYVKVVTSDKHSTEDGPKDVTYLVSTHVFNK